jgi:hypothetical protein
MGLADYTPLTRSVAFRRGGSVEVRGLSLDDIAVLMNLYLKDIDALFGLYDESRAADERVAEMARFAVVLVREAPALVGHAIALAADEPDQIDKARKMPLPVQVEVVKSILELTFEEAGGARKFFESLGSLLQTLVPAMKKTDSPT